MKASKLILSLFVGQILILFAAQIIIAQTEKLGIVNYTPPKGMARTPKENIVGYSQIDHVTGKY